jgi:hypothetical protein
MKLQSGDFALLGVAILLELGILGFFIMPVLGFGTGLSAGGSILGNALGEPSNDVAMPYFVLMLAQTLALILFAGAWFHARQKKASPEKIPG